MLSGPDLTANKSCCVKQRKELPQRGRELCLNIKIHSRIPPEAEVFYKKSFEEEFQGFSGTK